MNNLQQLNNPKNFITTYCMIHPFSKIELFFIRGLSLNGRNRRVFNRHIQELLDSKKITSTFSTKLYKTTYDTVKKTKKTYPAHFILIKIKHNSRTELINHLANAYEWGKLPHKITQQPFGKYETIWPQVSA